MGRLSENGIFPHADMDVVYVITVDGMCLRMGIQRCEAPSPTLTAHRRSCVRSFVRSFLPSFVRRCSLKLVLSFVVCSFEVEVVVAGCWLLVACCNGRYHTQSRRYVLRVGRQTDPNDDANDANDATTNGERRTTNDTPTQRRNDTTTQRRNDTTTQRRNDRWRTTNDGDNDAPTQRRTTQRRHNDTTMATTTQRRTMNDTKAVTATWRRRRHNNDTATQRRKDGTAQRRKRRQ